MKLGVSMLSSWSIFFTPRRLELTCGGGEAQIPVALPTGRTGEGSRSASEYAFTGICMEEGSIKSCLSPCTGSGITGASGRRSGAGALWEVGGVEAVMSSESTLPVLFGVPPGDIAKIISPSTVPLPNLGR